MARTDGITIVPCKFCDGEIDLSKGKYCPKCGVNAVREIILVPCAFCDGQIDLGKEEICPKCNHSHFEDPTPPSDFMVLVNRVALQLCDVNHKTGGHGDLSDLGNEIGIAIGEYHEENNLQYDIKDFISGLKHGLSLTNGTHG